MRRALVPLSAALLVALVGCSGTPPLPRTVKLAGTVTLDGKKLPEGTITFHPAEGQGAASVSAPITDGLFTAPAVPVGAYRVSFSGGRLSETPSGPISSDFGAPDPKAKKDPIPEKYRKPSLPADASTDNTALNFDLTSK